jgi:hypothetical protein
VIIILDNAPSIFEIAPYHQVIFSIDHNSPLLC